VQLNSVNQQGEVGQYEVFEYEGLYGYAEPMKACARRGVGLEAMEVDGKTFHGESNCRAMEPRPLLELSQHYDHDS
jgi:hypothetical protein